MREGDVEDAPFFRHKHDHLRASFRINYDTFIGYFVVVYPDDCDPKLL